MTNFADYYRPRRLEDLIGQKSVTVFLKAILDKDKVPSALLFEGIRGTGKTSAARIFAAALNCEIQSDPPCGRCASCEDIFEGNSLSVREIDASSQGGVDDIRSLQEDLQHAPLGRRRVVVLDEAMHLDTPIPTIDGWTTVGQCKEGEYVLTAEGLPTRVVRKTQVFFDKDCYKVTFNDGTFVVVSANHLWKARKQWRKVGIYTTEHLASQKGKVQVPRAAPWDLPVKSLPLDPYLLGLWLGDGDSGASHISGLKDDVVFYSKVLEARGINTQLLKEVPGKAIKLSFAGSNGSNQGNRIVRTVKGENKFGKSIGDTFYIGNPNLDEPSAVLRNMSCYRNKHIPGEYLRGSIEQRTELLQGLMDTDGYVGKDGHCTFVGTDELTEGVVELLRTLGQTCTKHWVSDVRSRKGGYFKVEFSTRLGLVPVKLPRKGLRVKDASDQQEWVSVKSIERVESVPVQCIEVEDSEHLFLAGVSALPTHNCHGLSRAASNALLKTLEAPTQDTVFILVSTDPQKILDTILSRCMSFRFRRVPPDEIVKRLLYICEQEHVSVENSLLQIVANSADCSVREAVVELQKILSAGINTVDSYQDIMGSKSAIDSLFDNILARNYTAMFSDVETLVSLMSVMEIQSEMGLFLKDVLTVHAGVDIVGSPESIARRRAFALKVSAPTTVECMKVIWDLRTKVKPAESSKGFLDLAVTMMAERLVSSEPHRISGVGSRPVSLQELQSAV